MTTAANPKPKLPRYDRELEWLDRVIELEMLRLRAHYELSLDELRGLYISDRQVDELLQRRAAGSGQPSRMEALQREAQALHESVQPAGPLATLVRRFGLTGTEADLLFLALAPEIALKYETLYAYLNNDITRKHASVDLAVRLMSNVASGEEARRALRPGGKLFTTGLLEWIDAGPDRRSLRAQGFALAPPVAQHLLGLTPDDPRLPQTIQHLEATSVPRKPPDLAESARAAVEEFALRHAVTPGLTLCVGDSNAELLSAVRLYAARHAYNVVAVPSSAIFADIGAWPALRVRVCLLAAVSPAVVALVDDSENLPRDPHANAQIVRAVRDLSGSAVPLFVPLLRRNPSFTAHAETAFRELVLPEASGAERAAAWQSALRRAGLEVQDGVAEEVGRRFVLSHSRITAAAMTAANLASTANAEGNGTDEAVWRAARRHSGQLLSQLTTRVTRPHRWEHLVLPDTTLSRVREVTSAIRERDRVFHTWGMAGRTGRGDGLMVLFVGASGTGKTMTASVIANSLGLELYRIDLAAVISKYIGETEKNLDRIFEAARNSNAILFFDEADALLGKRSEVKDAHDRYANIEVSYLLQKMEEHDGVAILATNLARNLDQAFARRMHYVIEFPRPDAPHRERLWRGMFPRETPLAPDIDFRFLAEQFETSGGDVQTVALDAAFLASAENGAIHMSHVVRAMARHQLKQGNPASVTTFKQYYDLVREG